VVILKSNKSWSISCILILILCSTLAFAADYETKWIAVGNLHDWFSNIGTEVETGRTFIIRDIQDGLRWPARFGDQDCKVSQALWIGARDYYDARSELTYSHKVVQAGPRNYDADNEFMPANFKMIGRFETPLVIINDIMASKLDSIENLDEIDPALPVDRMIYSVVNTSIGVTVTRKIFAFSQKYHDNYFINEYTFKNTGIIDEQGTLNQQTLNDVMFFFMRRYGISREGCLYGYNWLPISCSWGLNTMYDARNEYPESATGPTWADDAPPRCLFSWHGRHSEAEFDNIGGPYFSGDGHIGAAQYAGVITLHAQKSAYDMSDDPYQPATTYYYDSDAQFIFNHDQYDEAKMVQEYEVMMAGHPETRHADAVGDGFADQYMGTPGGFSQSQGFGPYNLEVGDSVRIVIAEGVAGLSRELCYEIGANWLAETGSYTLPSGSSTSDRDEYKNAWVATGQDSLFQTFYRALDAYKNGISIPQPPHPPEIFVVETGSDRIVLQWANNSEMHPEFAGYKLYRAEGSTESDYQLIFQCDKNNLVNLFEDLNVVPETDYFYYITAFDDGSTNDIQPGVPLESSKFYTMTSKPARLFLIGIESDNLNIIPTEFTLNQNYPNPFNPSTTISFGIPKASHVSIDIYDINGKLVDSPVDAYYEAGTHSHVWTAQNNTGGPLASGIYFYQMKAGTTILHKKLVLVR